MAGQRKSIFSRIASGFVAGLVIFLSVITAPFRWLWRQIVGPSSQAPQSPSPSPTPSAPVGSSSSAVSRARAPSKQPEQKVPEIDAKNEAELFMKLRREVAKLEGFTFQETNALQSLVRNYNPDNIQRISNQSEKLKKYQDACVGYQMFLERVAIRRGRPVPPRPALMENYNFPPAYSPEVGGPEVPLGHSVGAPPPAYSPPIAHPARSGAANNLPNRSSAPLQPNASRRAPDSNLGPPSGPAPLVGAPASGEPPPSYQDPSAPRARHESEDERVDRALNAYMSRYENMVGARDPSRSQRANAASSSQSNRTATQNNPDNPGRNAAQSGRENLRSSSSVSEQVGRLDGKLSVMENTVQALVAGTAQRRDPSSSSSSSSSSGSSGSSSSSSSSDPTVSFRVREPEGISQKNWQKRFLDNYDALEGISRQFSVLGVSPNADIAFDANRAMFEAISIPHSQETINFGNLSMYHPDDLNKRSEAMEKAIENIRAQIARLSGGPEGGGYRR